MKKYMQALLAAVLFLLPGCKDESEKNAMKFVVCADYPPFEYYEDGKIVGFDIDLAKAVAKKLGKKAVFEDMQLTTMLAAVQNGFADAAISALAATEERRKNYDFSANYYSESFASVYKKTNPINEQNQLSSAKIICQLGTSMEIWLKKTVKNLSLVTTDNNNQAIESLKAGHADCVFMDEVQASAFCKQNPGLASSHIATSGDGYAIVIKKVSMLKNVINNALKDLIHKGEIEKLKAKWMK
jgi:polar amino acid transport system substrate-binding protein